MLEIPLISLALFIVAIITLGLGLYSFANLRVRGAREFSLLMVSLTFYIAGFGMELLSETAAGILFWLRVEYIGIATIPAFCIAFAVRMAGDERWFRRWPMLLVLFFPILTLVLYYTNSWHHLFYRSFGAVQQISYYHELEIEKGAWYYVNIIYLNLALLASFTLFLRHLRHGGIERNQAWILILGSLGPWIAHLIYQAGLTKGFDISPFGFVLTAPLFAWGVFGNYMVFLIPKARNAVYHSFSDAVIIIDNYQNLIDYNTAAGNLFKDLKRNGIGKSLFAFLKNYPELDELASSQVNMRVQAKLMIDTVKRSFILSSSEVSTRHNLRLGLIIVMHEITDQVFLLDNLRESEEKYRLIFENTPVGFLLYDSSGKITTCNDTFVNIIGSSRDVLIGLNMLRLPDKTMVAAIEDSLKGGIGYYEHEYHSVTADKVTPVRGFFAPLSTKDGQIRSGVGIIEDFTDRFNADQKIKYREEFENILMTLELDFLNSEIGDMDSTFRSGLMRLGSFFKIDRADIFQIDYSKNNIISKYEWCSPQVEGEVRSWQPISLHSFSRWMERLSLSKIIYIQDISDLSDDWKSERDLLSQYSIRSLLVVPIAIRGELLGFAGFGTMHDLRTWNKDEIALLKVLGQIFASVINRKDVQEELVSARDRAEEASRVKSAFLANMSHEIRTPLNGILGFAELIQAEFDDPVIQRYSDIILSSGSRLLQTLSQILDLSRVESGKLDLVLEDVNIDQAIDDIILLFTPTAKKKGLFIERQHGGAGFSLRVDDQLFRNSLTNLISNAIKFTQQGGITLSTSIEKINGRRCGIIRVADTGIGIPEKFFSTIFEDFKQVSEGVKRNYEGTGLGLSLTKRFIELSGGSIQVESMQGFGATFIISFPDPKLLKIN